MKKKGLGKREIGFLLLWLQGIIACAEFPVSDIPDSLLTGADAVIRRNQVYFRYDSENTGHMECLVAITVMNDKGRELGDFTCYTDDFRELKRFAGTVYDRTGKKLREIRKSELFSTQFSSHLATDDWSHSYECRLGIYPYTVCYEYEMKYKKGMIGFPTFIPLYSWRTALQESSYCLDLPDEMNIKFKSVHRMADPIRHREGNRMVLEWDVRGIKAFRSEPFSPPLFDRIPLLYAAPRTFVYAGTRGSMNDWQAFGTWQAELLKGRDVLPELFQKEIIRMTETASDDREKVKILYEYLEKATRYVSIQLGIGGLQPIPAAQVCKTGFGDCKGLTNLMKAMLGVVDIPSDYVVIGTGSKRLFADFANVVQMDHAILRVPLPGDTLWLECTDPSLPFGYVHHAIAGHDAVVISNDGGRFCTVPGYPDSLNLETHRAEIDLRSDGSAIVKVCRKAWLSQYEKLAALKKIAPGEQVNYLARRVRVSDAAFSDLTIREIKEATPCAVLSYRLSTGKYGNSSGKRHFIPVNVFRSSFSLPTEKERSCPIVNDYGYMDCDTLIFRLPEGYRVESVPASVEAVTEFGYFRFSVTQNEHTITAIQRFYFPEGSYSPDRQRDFFSFLKLVSDAYQSKLVIRKEEE